MSTGDEWPNVEVVVGRTDHIDGGTELAALGYAACDLSNRMHDLINGN